MNTLHIEYIPYGMYYGGFSTLMCDKYFDVFFTMVRKEEVYVPNNGYIKGKQSL